MASVPTQTDFGTWSVDGHTPRIEYALPVLAELCADAVDGLRRFRHGGVEIGGVLFGEGDENLVRILAYRPLECEHAFGPRFVLSDRDRANLRDLLAECSRDAALRGLEAVGWYHSHTRSNIELSPRDLEIYDSYLPQRWQVALVVRPESYGPAQLGFFFREPGDVVRTASSYQEFEVTPARRRAPIPAEPVVEAVPLTADRAAEPEFGFLSSGLVPRRHIRLSAEPAAPPDEIIETGNSTPVDAPTPLRDRPAQLTFRSLRLDPATPTPEDQAAVPAARVESARVESARVESARVECAPAGSGFVEPAAETPEFAPVPGFAQAQAASASKRSMLWLVVPVALLAATAFGVQQYFQNDRPSQPLSLWVADMGGQLLIEWDRTAKPVRSARSASLEIRDGKDTVIVPIEADRLREGSIDYVRHSDIVDVRLRIRQAQGTAQEFLRFVGPPVRRGPSAAEVELQRENEALKADVAQLRALLNARPAKPRSARRGRP